jgi:ribosomal-protein-alanine N-acetyltransferase
MVMLPDPKANPEPSAISIRTAGPDDLAAILAIEQAVPLAAHWSPDHYRSRVLGQPEAACFLVAERSHQSRSEICGFLCARIVAGEWEIENVVVRLDFRRRGVGGQLMQALISRWRESAGTAVLLEVRESNAPARALYERHGLREVGRRPGYYRDPDGDAILYSLDREPTWTG